MRAVFLVFWDLLLVLILLREDDYSCNCQPVGGRGIQGNTRQNINVR